MSEPESNIEFMINSSLLLIYGKNTAWATSLSNMMQNTSAKEDSR